MALYIVGDVHGCVQALEQRLSQVGFRAQSDQLWSVGDLIGKGPASLAVLRLVDALGDRFQMVLGNHEMRLLGKMAGAPGPVDPALQPILDHGSAPYWEAWLRQRPLLLRDPKRRILMTHAGVFPGWSLAQAEHYAEAACAQLRQGNRALQRALFRSPYKGAAQTYSGELANWVQIFQAFTQMRYCRVDEAQQPAMDFSCKTPKARTEPLVPWFGLWPEQKETWLFGHWSDLEGDTGRSDIQCLDTGCVYGGALSMVRVEDGRLTRV